MAEFALPGVKGCCCVPGKSSWFPSGRDYEGYSRSFSPSFHLEVPSSSVDSFFSVFLYIPSYLFFIYSFPPTSYTTNFLYLHPGGLPAAWIKWILCSHPCKSLHTERTESAVKTGQEKIGKWSKNVKSRFLPFSWKTFWLWALPPCPHLH